MLQTPNDPMLRPTRGELDGELITGFRATSPLVGVNLYTLPETNLRLVESRPFGNGVVLLRYERAADRSGAAE